MISSIIARQQGLVSSGQATSTLESGLISLALQAWVDQYQASPDAASLIPIYSNYVDSILSAITTQPAFTNVTAATLLPLDRLTIAQAINHVASQTASGARELTALETEALATLSNSLSVQQRNALGGFWYYVYPQWSYLDGTVSFLPFMVASESWSRADTLLQITLLWEHCQDRNGSGLLVHGYDAGRTAVWADPVTGGSPFVWGRSLGWYLVGLVNAWEELTASDSASASASAPANVTVAQGGGVVEEGGGCRTEAECAALLGAIAAQFGTLANNLVRYQDQATGAWWQLPTLGGESGNYLESSSTALFVFALLKALRLELLVEEPTTANSTDFKLAALKGYDALLNRFVVEYTNGSDASGAVLGYNGTVTVCSLNSTANYTYYTHQPLVSNAPLGSAAFVLASLEMERLGL